MSSCFLPSKFAIHVPAHTHLRGPRPAGALGLQVWITDVALVIRVLLGYSHAAACVVCRTVLVAIQRIVSFGMEELGGGGCGRGDCGRLLVPWFGAGAGGVGCGWVRVGAVMDGTAGGCGACGRGVMCGDGGEHRGGRGLWGLYLYRARERRVGGPVPVHLLPAPPSLRRKGHCEGR